MCKIDNNIYSATAIALIFMLLFCIAVSFIGCSNEEETSIFEYSVSELSVRKKDVDIYGKLYLPDYVSNDKPLVILAHSANLTSDSLESYAIGFAKRGYVAYAFDFCGGSSQSRSGGSVDDMTVFSECDDLHAVIDFLVQLEYVDINKVYLFGTSMGGLVCALTAETVDNVQGQILLYPAFNIPELVSKYSGYIGGSLMGGYGKAFCDSLQDYDVYEHIGNFDGNVLIIHGSKDFIVNSSYSQRAYDRYARCTLKIIENAGHGFNTDNYSIGGDYDDEVWQFIDEYFTIEND
ncbi:MAG: alpha/beta hydrolase family protein [Christensenellales bacterium]